MKQRLKDLLKVKVSNESSLLKFVISCGLLVNNFDKVCVETRDSAVELKKGFEPLECVDRRVITEISDCIQQYDVMSSSRDRLKSTLKVLETQISNDKLSVDEKVLGDVCSTLLPNFIEEASVMLSSFFQLRAVIPSSWKEESGNVVSFNEKGRRLLSVKRPERKPSDPSYVSTTHRSVIEKPLSKNMPTGVKYVSCVLSGLPSGDVGVQPIDVDKQVKMLIECATDDKVLAQVYEEWMPWI